MTIPEPMTKSPTERRLISLRTGDLIARGLKILKKSLLRVILISLFALVLPQFIFTWSSATQANVTAAYLQQLSVTAASDSPRFLQATEIIGGFLARLGGAALVLWFVMLMGYSAIIRIALDRLSRRRQRTPSALILESFRTTILKSYPATVLAGVLIAIAQIFPPAALIIAVLAIMIPVLAVAESGNPVSLLFRSLTLRYVPRNQFGRWPVFFAVLSLGGVFYILEFALTFLVESANSLESRVELLPDAIARLLATPLFGRGLFANLPYTPLYAVVDTVDTLVGVALLPVLAAASSLLYMRARASRAVIAEN